MSAQAQCGADLLLGPRQHQQKHAVGDVGQNRAVDGQGMRQRGAPCEIDRKPNGEDKAHAGERLLEALALGRDGPRTKPFNKRITDCPGTHHVTSPLNSPNPVQPSGYSLSGAWLALRNLLPSTLCAFGWLQSQCR